MQTRRYEINLSRCKTAGVSVHKNMFITSLWSHNFDAGHGWGRNMGIFEDTVKKLLSPSLKIPINRRL